MSNASSSRSRPRPGRAGTSTLEFGLVAVPFFLLLIGAMDLGRYFITQQSLRTLTSEAARSMMVDCIATNPCSLATNVPAPQTLWTKVPFLNSSEPGSSLAASQTVDANGIRTITVTAQYPFTFFLPLFADIVVNEACGGTTAGSCPGNTICETTCLTY